MGEETDSVVLLDIGWESEVVATIIVDSSRTRDEVDTTFSVVLFGTTVLLLRISKLESDICENVMEADEDMSVSVLPKMEVKIEVKTDEGKTPVDALSELELDTEKVVSSTIDLAEVCANEVNGVDIVTAGSMPLEDWILSGDDIVPLVSLGEDVVSIRLVNVALAVDLSKVMAVLL